MVKFNALEDVEVDYQLDDFFPKKIRAPLQPLIECRVKLMLKESTLFRQGESQVVNNTWMLKSKMKNKHGKLFMHLIDYQNLPLSFESEGQVEEL